MSVFTDLGETEFHLIEEIFPGFISDVVQLLCLNSGQLASRVAKVTANNDKLAASQ